LITDVVLPTPPFWLKRATTRAAVALQRLGLGDRPGPSLGGGVDGTDRTGLLAVLARVGRVIAASPGGGAHVVGGEQSAVLPATVYRHAHQSVGLSNA
jgi:hypothetical protein